MTIEQQDFSFELKTVTDEGSFTGYGSVFGVEDQGADIVLKGAFAASIADYQQKNRKVPMLWAHDQRSPIGVYTTMREDDYGLYVEGRFTKGVAKAQEVHALMKDGVVSGLSIGFRTIEYEIDNDAHVRRLKKLDLMEISPVTFPMLDVARTVSIKSDFKLDPRALERELKEMCSSLSNSDAVKAIAIVKKHLQRDAAGDSSVRDGSEAYATLLAELRQARAS